MCTKTFGYKDVFFIKYKQHPEHIGMCTQTIYWCIYLFFMKRRQYPDHVGMCTQTIYGLPVHRCIFREI